MPYVRDSFWRGRSFAGPADMQARASTWCTQVAGVRSHRNLDGARPLSVFRAVEAPELLALPDRVFQLARWSHRRSPRTGARRQPGWRPVRDHHGLSSRDAAIR